MSRAPQRVFVAAVLIRIGFGGNVLSRGALAFFIRIGIGRHRLLSFDLAFAAAFFVAPALLRSASFKSIGTPCFFRRSAKASSASSCKVAIRPRPSCVSLSKVSSSKPISLRMVCILKSLSQSYSEAAYQAQLQLQRTEFVPVRKRSASVRSGEDERGRGFATRRLFSRS